MTQQWAGFAKGTTEPHTYYPTEAAAYNDPVNIYGYVRVRRVELVGHGPDAHWVPAGPWLATDPDDPLWGPRTPTDPVGLTPVAQDLLGLVMFVCILLAVVAGIVWFITQAVAG